MYFLFLADYFDDNDFGGGGFDDDFANEHIPETVDDPIPSTSKDGGGNSEKPSTSVQNKFIKKHGTKQIDQVIFSIILLHSLQWKFEDFFFFFVP